MKRDLCGLGENMREVSLDSVIQQKEIYLLLYYSLKAATSVASLVVDVQLFVLASSLQNEIQANQASGLFLPPITQTNFYRQLSLT